MSERYACMCGHKPGQHNPNDDACDAADCECQRYVEYDHSDDHYTGPRGGEAEQRHSQERIQRELKR